MDDETITLTRTPPLRRVGAHEGAGHAVAFAAAFVLLGRAFETQIAFAVPPAAGVFWLGWYGALRAARVRDWFGRWDAVSFGFVAGYAVVLALAVQAVLLRWA
ncbi:MAG: hypothetical protein HYV96_19545 [Opitutae bacterium]|nr:hypothetical protein [Opitutae bacterium]